MQVQLPFGGFANLPEYENPMAASLIQDAIKSYELACQCEPKTPLRYNLYMCANSLVNHAISVNSTLYSTDHYARQFAAQMERKAA